MSRLLYIPSVNIFTSIKYGYLYNWWAATNPATIENGALYNWYAATDARNICNIGWHIPTRTEITTLQTYLGGQSVAGGKLKETGLLYWNDPNTSATNETWFNGRGSGRRTVSGLFENTKSVFYMWSSTTYSADYAWYAYINSSNAGYFINADYKKQGFSIRPMKDSTTLTNGQTGTYTGNDGRVYQTICIGTQEWLSENLMETKYRNGDAIPEVTDNTAWAALTTGARCSYNNTLSNAGTGNAITSSDDWVVPTLADRNTFMSYVGTNGAYKVKETGIIYWNTGNTGTNELLYNGRGSGYRQSDGIFINLKATFNFWFTSGVTSYWVNMDISNTISLGGGSYTQGNSIRLVYVGSGTPTSYIGNDGKIYRIVKIGTQYWLADNLAETKYRDGSIMPEVTDNTAWAALTTGARCAYNNDESNM